ncbi:MAG: DUF2851 family protein [Bacteroidales bacterium]
MNGEELLCFVWEHRYFKKQGFTTTSGLLLEVIHPGYRNMHAGPDFRDARIRIGSLVWAGNVEVHLRSGDWKRHRHHLDPVYNSVILHVVLQYEAEIINASGRQVHTCVLGIPEPIRIRFEQLHSPIEPPLCKPFLGRVNRTFLYTWIRQLGRMRMGQKTDPASGILADRALSREEALYRLLGRGFGLPVNTLPFEWLTSGIPYSLVSENRHSLPDLEAILFGQAGFLNAPQTVGPYFSSLKERYHHFDKFFPSGPMACHLWKYLRLRPAAFPTVRIAQFASLLHHRIPLVASIVETGIVEELEQQFRVKASEFWDTHYLFQKSTAPAPKFIGSDTFQILLINVVVPYIRALGLVERRKEYLRKADEMLMEVAAEYNHIIKKWINFGVRPGNALESQGLIQLHNIYCTAGRCLDCKLGICILEDSMNEKS